MSDVKDRYEKAEAKEFPRVPDDKVYCAVRGQMVGVTDCATDACVAPEERAVCWDGHVAAAFEEATR